MNLDNPCLRPAALHEVCFERHPDKTHIPPFGDRYRYLALFELYRAEWRLRGYERSP